MQDPSPHDNPDRAHHADYPRDPSEHFTGTDVVHKLVTILDRAHTAPGGNGTARRAAANELARALGASCWYWAITRTDQHGRPIPLTILHGGLTDAQLAAVIMGWAEFPPPPAEFEGLANDLASHEPVVRLRSDWVSDDAWANCPHRARHRRPAGLGEFAALVVPLEHPSGARMHSLLYLHRAEGTGPIDPALAYPLCHGLAEAHALHRGAIPTNDGHDTLTLRDHLRATMAFLLCGWRRADIVRHTGWSEHTTRDRIRKAYDRLKVRSHVDLVRAFTVIDPPASEQIEPKPNPGS